MEVTNDTCGQTVRGVVTPHFTEMIAMGERVDFAERLLTPGPGPGAGSVGILHPGLSRAYRASNSGVRAETVTLGSAAT